MPNFVKIIFGQIKNKVGIRHMKDFNVKFDKSLLSNFFELNLSEIARQGAQHMLKLTLEAEIEGLLSSTTMKKPVMVYNASFEMIFTKSAQFKQELVK